MKAFIYWILSWLINVAPFYFICPYCGQIASSGESDDIIEWGTVLTCNECGKETTLILIKDNDDLARHI